MMLFVAPLWVLLYAILEPVSARLAKRWDHPSCSVGEANSALVQTGSCCGALSHFRSADVSYPGNAIYNASLASYWALQEAEIHPSCVFTPTNSDDVSLAVFILNIGGKVHPGDCQFAIRSGGHAPGPGLANIQPGVTIDLSLLNQLTISSDRSTIRIGPGNRWRDVYELLDSKNLSTSGGRVADVGVGGLILGGGVSFFSPRYGSVCDNVENFEIVLASGEIVNANATSHTDLTKALRGGSNNFGIVTAFDMRLFPQGKFWGGFVGNNISTRYTWFDAFTSFTGDPNYDPYAALINSYVWIPALNDWEIASNLEYTQPVVNPPYFHNITTIPQTFSTMRISNLTDFTVELSASTPPGRRDLFATGTYGNSAAILAKIFDLANATAQPLIDIVNISFSISFQPQPQVIIQESAVSNSGVGNSLGLEASDGNLFNLLLSISWDNVEDDARIVGAAKNFIAEAEQAAESLGVSNPYIYLNYAAVWQDPIDGYGVAVKSQLQEVSKKYDPTGVFQKQVPGGFKLFV